VICRDLLMPAVSEHSIALVWPLGDGFVNANDQPEAIWLRSSLTI
jgi:hypothetical protein